MKYLFLITNLIVLMNTIKEIMQAKDRCVCLNILIDNIKGVESEKFLAIEEKNFQYLKIEFYIISAFFIIYLLIENKLVLFSTSIIVAIAVIILSKKKCCNMYRAKDIDIEKAFEEVELLEREFEKII